MPCSYNNCKEKTVRNKCIFCNKYYCYNHVQPCEHMCKETKNYHGEKKKKKKKKCAMCDKDAIGMKCTHCGIVTCAIHKSHKKHPKEKIKISFAKQANVKDAGDTCCIIC